MPVPDPDGSFRPLPKPQRCRSRRSYEAARLEYCEICGQVATADLRMTPHHVRTRGARGGDNPANLLSVCPSCHKDIHDGKIPRAEVENAVRRRGD